MRSDTLPAATFQSAEKVGALLNAEQAAERLGVSRAWILAHANGQRRPKLPSAKLGKLVRFRPEDLERFIEECSR
jgi:excisionase family DNA binding protein